LSVEVVQLYAPPFLIIWGSLECEL